MSKFRDEDDDTSRPVLDMRAIETPARVVRQPCRTYRYRLFCSDCGKESSYVAFGDSDGLNVSGEYLHVCPKGHISWQDQQFPYDKVFWFNDPEVVFEEHVIRSVTSEEDDVAKEF